MISWGSFLLGGLIFSCFSFILGIIIGNNSSNESSGSFVYCVSKNVLKHLHVGETISFNTYIAKTNDDEDDNSEEELIPDIPEQNWRNN